MNVQLIPKEFWEERRRYREQASAPSATTPNSAISNVAAPQSYQPELSELAMYKDIGGQAAQSSEGNIAAMVPTAYRGVSKYVGRHGEQAYTNMGASSEQPSPSPSLMTRTSSLASVSAPVARQPQTSMPDLAENPLRNQLIEEYKGIQQMIQDGMTTNIPGRRLTADGLRALMGRASDISRQLGSDVAAQNQIVGQLSSTALQGQNQLNIENARLQNQLEADASSGLMEGRMAQADYYRSMAEANRANTRRVVPPSELIPQPVLTGFDDTDIAALEAHNARANMADATFNAVLVASKQLGVDPLEYLQKKIEELGNFSIIDPQTGAVSEELKREKENRLRAYTDAMTALIRNGFFIGSQTSKFAEGGLVTPPPEPSMIQNYQQYIEMARKMGLPPIGFEQYAQLQGPSPADASAEPASGPGASAQRAVIYGDHGLRGRWGDP